MVDRGDRGELAERVRAQRLALGLTQAELAEAAQLAPSTIGDIESGRSHATRNLDLLARALKTTPEHLRSGRPPLPVLREGAAELTPRERAFLSLYRALSPANRLRVEAFMQGMGATPKRKPRGAGSAPRRGPVRKLALVSALLFSVLLVRARASDPLPPLPLPSIPGPIIVEYLGNGGTVCAVGSDLRTACPPI